MKKVNTAILLLVICNLLFQAKPVLALTPTVSIQDLPSYVTRDNFLISCSSLGGSSVQFSYKKDGGSYQNFGSAIDVTSNPCQVQVTSSQISEQTKYYFRATLDGSVSDETNTIYDVSGPSPVNGFRKDDGGNNTLVIHWRNPNNEDFAKVIIYRGATVDFSADGNHEIATVTGSPDSEMTYSINVDATKPYYAIRAIDKAGNSSGLVGDGSSSSSTTNIASNGTTSGTGTGSRGGSVLGTSESVKVLPVESASPSAETSTESESQSSTDSSASSKNNTWRNVGIGVILVLIAFFVLRRMKKI